MRPFLLLSLSLALCQAFHADFNGTSIRDLRTEYDFVIVGGGSAGCRIADVLSSSGEFTVLVLEAGGVPPESSKIPLLALMPYNSKEYDWIYRSVPQKTSMLAAKNKVRTLNAARNLGGGSTWNMMYYQRGNFEDYDRWERDFGAKGWGSKEVLELFKEVEGADDMELSDDFHGRHGPLGVTTFRDEYPLKEAFFEAAEKTLGLNYSDQNDGNHWGSFHLTATIKRGRRVSSFNAFIEPNLNRGNLHISLYSQVLKIDFEDKRASGITIIKDGVRRSIRASKEVVLSAGAFRSPQLLMLSGIGDEAHLKEFKIPLRSHLPGVGKNLQDHFGHVGILAKIPDDDVPDFDDVRGLKQWLFDQTGPFAKPPGVGLGLLYTSTGADKRSPDVELIPQAAREDLLGSDLPDEMLREYYGEFAGQSMLSFIHLVQKPKSRGELRLASADPIDYPQIDMKYFSHPDDVKSAVSAAKQVVELLRSDTMRKAGVRLVEKHFPPCKEFDLFSEEYLSCLATHHTVHVFHYCGTCRIGAQGDPLAVVDERLRVRGVDGLRVVDTSVIPSIPVGHLNAPVIMIASKAGKMILEEYDDSRPRKAAGEL
ncbi:uncharacterized protein LOC100899481 [Galendromus occidentalis]|uniref:Uncharacterized protein LOC100899481 n=1 Tax=Galendromus occidentalis TaxID=34638 RepID=A0AAJ6QXS6_9ACAR|nr:uncharacterized protein LOC100899481 [Galendromus occidentalis]